MVTRRNFLRNSTLLAASLGTSSLFASNMKNENAPSAYDPGKKVNLAVIGVGMGCRDMQGALRDNPWVHCVGMCDVNKERLESQIAAFKKEFPDQTGLLGFQGGTGEQGY